jgi:hypothetical protein
MRSPRLAELLRTVAVPAVLPTAVAVLLAAAVL